MISIARFQMKQRKFLCVLLLGICPVLAGASVAGHVQFVTGDVRIFDSKGVERPARKGQSIDEGETLKTALNSSAQLKMVDGAMLAIRPGTQLKFDAYSFNATEDGTENALISLVKGGLRAITGIIGNRSKEKFKLRTPTATIGIRGTDHESVVVLPPLPGEAMGIQPGTYDKVNVGATTLTTQAGTTLILPNQVGFAASPDQIPVILPKLPDFFQTTSAPQSKSDQKSDEKQEQKQEVAVQKEAVADIASTGAIADNAVMESVSTVNLVATDVNGNLLNVSEQSLTSVDGVALGLDAKAERGVGIVDSWGRDLFEDGVFIDFGGFFHGGIDGDIQPASKVIDNSNGLLEFAGTAKGYTPVDASTSVPIDSDSPATIKVGTAVNQDVGSLNMSGTTLAWGRWEGGNIDIYSPDGAVKLGTINNANRSVHWLTTSAMGDTFFQLPLTGTASYTVVGNTHPTDLKGNVGTLGSVMLKADFANAKASASLDASFKTSTNTSNWSITASNIPLIESEFRSDNMLNGTNGIVQTVSCTGPSCGPKSIGSLNGLFILNAQGAVMTYSLATGTASLSLDSKPIFTPDNVVTGAVVMKR